MMPQRFTLTTEDLRNYQHDDSVPGSPEALVGVISDTHGLLRPEALEALRGVDRIVHAGDVDQPEILERLEGVAPVSAVRGNMDRGRWADTLPETRVVEAGDCLLYVLHRPERLDLDPAAAGFDAVIHGHTHEPRREVRDGVLYLNPGSAGTRRGERPVTLAHLRAGPEGVEAEIVELV